MYCWTKVLEDCYFKDDYSTLVTELTKIYNKPEEISQLLNQTKHDKYVEENLGSIEKISGYFYEQK